MKRWFCVMVVFIYAFAQNSNFHNDAFAFRLFLEISNLTSALLYGRVNDMNE